MSPSAKGAVSAVILTSVLLAGCFGLETERPQTSPDAGAAKFNVSRPTSAEGPFTVGSVTDGDTIRVGIDGKSTPIRLIGIDTPEVSHPQKPIQCFGREASERAHELMDGSQVWLEYDPSQGRRDRYGRTLAYVWLDESVLINETMVSEGFAREYTYDDAYKYREAFRDAEEAARTAGRGLWNPASCAGGSTD
jgi:endonuclease YncB( thermonuclease family)